MEAGNLIILSFSLTMLTNLPHMLSPVNQSDHVHFHNPFSNLPKKTITWFGSDSIYYLYSYDLVIDLFCFPILNVYLLLLSTHFNPKYLPTAWIFDHLLTRMFSLVIP